ncbi:hypothetical protein FKW77_010326 [Venturia effusa]|uniref:Wings apart-like protein C-terminal domain-containing protein n=1 Tax=Venturia effusa TaxID=50376 RepID=A0A517L4I9_9PEZI|nr:hypothetical protein FKW77_010326 [Venturia effusa]
MSVFELPAKQRKITTYGRKTSRPDAYTILKDDVSPERPRQTAATPWKKRTTSISGELPQRPPDLSKPSRPPPKRKQDTAWGVPSEDDEPLRTLTLTPKHPAKTVASKPLSFHLPRANRAPQHDHGINEVAITVDNEKKRKRETVTRATSEAPQDLCKEVDVYEAAVEADRMARRARSVEPSPPVKSRALPLAKKMKAVEDDFDFPSDEERLLTSRTMKAVSSRLKEDEACDTLMDKQQDRTSQSRSKRIREVSRPAKERTRAPSFVAKDGTEFGSRKEVEQSWVAKASKQAARKSKAMDIFDVPSDEESLVPKKSRSSKARSDSQPPKKRTRSPATHLTESISGRSRETKSPGPARAPGKKRTAKVLATNQPIQFSMQQSESLNAMTDRPKTLPGVGWQPNLSTHNSPRRLQQGSSAPAALFNMIREHPQSPPTDSSENVTRAVTPELDSDDEMEIDTTVTPPVAAPASPSTVRAEASSQTPKQNSLWGQLLNTGLHGSPSDLPFSKLNLKSTRKPPPIPRSSSDIPQTTFSRRSRLIDSLKASAPIVEIEDKDDDGEGDTSMESSPEPMTVKVETARPAPSVRTSSAKVTYAQQHTFLKEKNEEEEMYDMLAEELSQQTGGHSSQNQNNILEESDPEDSQEAAPRGVHDLRAAGAKKRLYDELDHLVEDVQGKAVKTVAARRSALMEVAEKIMDPEAARILLDSGMDLRLIKGMEDITDITFAFLAATIIALLANAGATLNTLDRIHGSKVFGRIVTLLQFKQDISKIVKERRSNMSRVAQSSIIDFRETILKSSLFTGIPPSTLSPRLMAIRCLDFLVRKIREQDSHIELLDEQTIENLLRIAQSVLVQDSADVTLLEPIVSILEAHTLSRSASWSLEGVQLFAKILPAIFGSTEPALQHTKFLALRLALNLTNENHAASDIFAIPALTKNLVQFIHQQCALLRTQVDSEVHAINIDNTILALGVMINLSEFSDQVRVSVLHGGDELLTQAVRIFLESKELAEKADSVEEGQINVAFGYHAFMLGNLCQNERVREVVRRQLPGKRLTLLRDEMQGFTNLHRRMDKVRLQGEEGEDLERGHVQRLQALVDTLVALDR